MKRTDCCRVSDPGTIGSDSARGGVVQPVQRTGRTEMTADERGCCRVESAEREVYMEWGRRGRLRARNGLQRDKRLRLGHTAAVQSSEGGHVENSLGSPA